MTLVAIHQPEYFSVPSYVDKLLRSDVFILLDSVQFNRASLQHRMLLLDPNFGPIWQTIPFVHAFPQRINEVRISPMHNKQWPSAHRAALHAWYCRAPFYAEIAAKLDLFFVEGRDTFVCTTAAFSTFRLADWLPPCVNAIVNVDAAMTVGEWRGYHAPLSTDKTGRLVDLVQRVGGDTYLSGYTGYSYLDLAQFDKAGIRVIRQHVEIAPYPQIGSPTAFIPHLSILDMLCNVGIDDTRRRIEAGRRA